MSFFNHDHRRKPHEVFPLFAHVADCNGFYRGHVVRNAIDHSEFNYAWLTDKAERVTDLTTDKLKKGVPEEEGSKKKKRSRDSAIAPCLTKKQKVQKAWYVYCYTRNSHGVTSECKE